MKRRLGAAALAVALTLPLAAAPAFAEEPTQNDPKVGGTQGWPKSSFAPLGELSSVEQSSRDNRIADDEEYEAKWNGAIRMDQFTSIIEKAYDIKGLKDENGKATSEAERVEANAGNFERKKTDKKSTEDILGSSLRRDAARNVQFGETLNILIAAGVLTPILLGLGWALSSGVIKLPECNLDNIKLPF
ncbi:hypothetical protein [Corynebacterium aquatimens]|uniref:Secreted protein n=1 Tax=Corynebacterium aquatimens TaxID=1190508 RepID=A0A931GWL4_9CORY|nr:hypothetical protein [Corynebacterium aquatimens]MBG6122731.1 hypothetical protein [Corynebacterium aquatimens]WJY66932.1 hypothetical protein CAQUA_11245 [Corynebacterium aquatimens]